MVWSMASNRRTSASALAGRPEGRFARHDRMMLSSSDGMTRPERIEGGIGSAWRCCPIIRSALSASKTSSHRFLVERFHLTYAASASVWLRLGERRRPGGFDRVLALAPHLERLPATREEVEGIHAEYRGHATLLVGPSASAAALRSGVTGHDVIHLATVGVLNKHNPLFSYVELAGGGEEPGSRSTRCSPYPGRPARGAERARPHSRREHWRTSRRATTGWD
jgi:hypothetical protein